MRKLYFLVLRFHVFPAYPHARNLALRRPVYLTLLTRSSGTAVALTHPHPTLVFTTCPRRSLTAPLTAVCFYPTDHISFAI